jgi:hypothetical protein
MSNVHLRSIRDRGLVASLLRHWTRHKFDRVQIIFSDGTVCEHVPGYGIRFSEEHYVLPPTDPNVELVHLPISAPREEAVLGHIFAMLYPTDLGMGMGTYLPNWIKAFMSTGRRVNAFSAALPAKVFRACGCFVERAHNDWSVDELYAAARLYAAVAKQ